MYRMIVRKAKRTAAIALACAMVFGSVGVLAGEPEEAETPAAVEMEEADTPADVETEGAETPTARKTETAAQECALVDENTGIRLEAEDTEKNKEIFSGITMTAEAYTDADALQYVRENIEPYGEIQAYSVTVKSNETVMLSYDSMPPKIYVPVPEGWDPEEIGSFQVGDRIVDNTGSISLSEDGKYICFTEDHMYQEFTELTVTFGIFQKSPETVTKLWKDTVDTFIQYMRFVNWETENQGGGVISRHFFEETAAANDVALVTYYRQGYYREYYVEETREVRIPYDVFVTDAKKYYKNVPDLTKISTLDGALYYDGEAKEFVWPTGGGKGSEPLVTEIERVDELGNETYGIRFKVSEDYDISENPDMSNPDNYITCTLVVEANENGQWRYVSFLEGYPKLDPVEPESHEHHFSAWDNSKTDDNYHYYVCDEEGCSVTKKEAHNLTWRTTDYATDIEGGYKSQTCTVCGYSVGDKVYIPPLADSPIFATNISTWDGDSDLVFQVATQGLHLGVSYSIQMKNGDTIGSKELSYDSSEETGNMTVYATEIRDRLSDFNFTWEDVEEIIFEATFVKVDDDKNVTHSINKRISIKPDDSSTEPVAPYSPELSLESSTWTGESDIVFDTQTKGGTVEFSELYLYTNGASIGGMPVMPKIELDSDGNGKITFNNKDLKNSKMFGPNGEETIDWTRIDKMEFSFYYTLGEESVFRTVYVPVDMKASTPTETTTITSGSGVTVTLPANAPDNLELKVDETKGTDERSAVEKVVKIDGNKIKTFDLFLLLNGQVYEFNGQFTATVSLPIPSGWAANKLALYYFNEDTKEVTPVAFRIDKENGMVVFNTNHFSKYVLVQKDTTSEETTKLTGTGAPRTGDQINFGLYVSLLSVSGLLVTILAVLRKKKVFKAK